MGVSLQISPYDLPEAFRGYYRPETGTFRIEFKYPDNEPSEQRRLDNNVTIDLGQFSRKLLTIDVAVDRFRGAPLFGQLHILLDKADAAIERLRHEVPRPNAKLNYNAIEVILKTNRENPLLIAG